jgi:hypothetical protein
MWEYQTIAVTGALGYLKPSGSIDLGKLTGELNRLGAEGWDVAVGFDTNVAGGRTGEVVIVLKRPRRA